MDEQVVGIHSLCDDLLRAMRHREDRQAEMSDAEVMTSHHRGALVQREL